LLCASLALGCDQGKQRDEPPGVGLALVPVTMVNANIGKDTPLPANQPIQLQFDRLLQPSSITRQTFVLQPAGGRGAFMPNVAYDPVSRIVTITPLPDTGQMLTPGLSYQLVIESPQTAADVNGLRAIDGAGLSPSSPQLIAFNVIDPTSAPPVTITIDFCRDIEPILQPQCGLSTCHGAVTTTSGTSFLTGAALVLDPARYIAPTAIGQVAHSANTGAQSLAASPTLLFGQDMPIIDGSGNPSNSWLMYKLLLAIPAPEPEPVTPTADAGTEADAEADATVPDASSDASVADAGLNDGQAEDGGSSEAGAEAGAADAGTTTTTTKPPPVDVSQAHAFPVTDLTVADRAVLTNYVQGLQMPVPPPNSKPASGLPLSQLERISLWIAQGSELPASGTCNH
jgi:hypothetical protein